MNENEIREALHASRVVDLSVANSQGPLGLEAIAEAVDRIAFEFRREGDMVVASCREFDIASQGDTREAAAANLRAAIALFLECASPSEVKRRYRSS